MSMFQRLQGSQYHRREQHVSVYFNRKLEDATSWLPLWAWSVYKRSDTSLG